MQLVRTVRQPDLQLHQVRLCGHDHLCWRHRICLEWYDAKQTGINVIEERVCGAGHAPRQQRWCRDAASPKGIVVDYSVIVEIDCSPTA
jgi:hypothetical protein